MVLDSLHNYGCRVPQACFKMCFLDCLDPYIRACVSALGRYVCLAYKLKCFEWLEPSFLPTMMSGFYGRLDTEPGEKAFAKKSETSFPIPSTLRSKTGFCRSLNAAIFLLTL